jgi:nitrite reductase (NADH) small subunit
VAFQRAAKVAEIPAGEIREINLGGTSVAIARIDGNFFAINSVCLHHGGPLGEGSLEGTVVTCPWHGWQYDVTSGRLLQQPSDGVQCYAVEVRADEVFVDIA